jgi:hypothetical protein
VITDVSKEKDVQVLFEKTVAEFGTFSTWRYPIPMVDFTSPSGRLDLLFNVRIEVDH